MEADNENEPLSFISLAAATANAIRFLGLDECYPRNDGAEDADKRQNNSSVLKPRPLAERSLGEIGRDVDAARGHRRQRR